MSSVIKAEEGEIYDIELAEDLKQANNKIAIENKKLLSRHGVKAIDILGSS